MNFGFKLSWWFNKHLNIYGKFDLDREITQNDNTTYANETLMSDTTIGLTYHNLYRIPVAGIDIHLGGKLIMPTSTASRADTAIVDIGLNLTLARTFKVLKGLTISYTFAPKYNFHRYTTGESVSPRVSVSAKDPDYNALLSNGTRNVQWDLGNDISFSLAFTDWIGMGFSWGRIVAFLYKMDKSGDLTVTTMSGQEVQLSHGVEDPTNCRFIDYFNLYVTATPIEFLDISLVAGTVYSQIDMDGKYEAPFFNEDTTIALELGVNFGALSTFISKHKKK